MTQSEERSGPWRASEIVSAEHPAFAGHFPGDPLLPGVVVIDKLIQQIQKHEMESAVPATSRLHRFRLFRLESVKFLHGVRPKEELTFQWGMQGDTLRFEIFIKATLVAKGSLAPLSPDCAGNDRH